MLNECGEQKKVSDISMHSQRGRWERGKITGETVQSNPKSGVVEISLTWDNEEVDLDLQVGWSAGSVDVKDICDLFEHFHIRSEATIYPGTFGVSIMPKNTNIIKITQTLTSLQAPINYNLKHQTTRIHS